MPRVCAIFFSGFPETSLNVHENFGKQFTLGNCRLDFDNYLQNQVFTSFLGRIAVMYYVHSL